MKILGDNLLHVSQFGIRSPRTDSIRYYYQVVGYDDLVLVCHDYSYREWDGRAGIVLVNSETIDGSIICQQFPNAPKRWHGRSDLVQMTVRVDKRLTLGNRVLLRDAVMEFLGPATTGVLER